MTDPTNPGQPRAPQQGAPQPPRGPGLPPVPPPPPAIPRQAVRTEPNTSAPGEDLPGAPVAPPESPSRDVPESATLAGGLTSATPDATDEAEAPSASRTEDAPATPTSAATTSTTLTSDSTAVATTEPVPGPVDEWIRQQVAEGRWSQPHDVLGPHPVAGGTSVRVVRHLATAVRIVRPDGDDVELRHEGEGVWAGATVGELGRYRVEADYEDDETWTTDDAYRFPPTLGELDLHLFGEGRDEQLWHHLGAHVQTVDGVDGVAFAVWAPRATAVRVIGDFEGWEGRTTAMRRLNELGVWELFWPGALEGQRYKFQILTDSGWVERADPFARRTEVPPLTASVITSAHHTWSEGDARWMAERATATTHDAPMSVYEVHLGSWRPGLSYREVADDLIGHLQYTGFTHVQFLPLAEHPFGGSWGYQVTGYYSPTARFGSPDDLRYLIDRLHSAGIGVIMDWVPGHFP